MKSILITFIGLFISYPAFSSSFSVMEDYSQIESPAFAEYAKQLSDLAFDSPANISDDSVGMTMYQVKPSYGQEELKMVRQFVRYAVGYNDTEIASQELQVAKVKQPKAQELQEAFYTEYSETEASLGSEVDKYLKEQVLPVLNKFSQKLYTQNENMSYYYIDFLADSYGDEWNSRGWVILDRKSNELMYLSTAEAM